MEAGLVTHEFDAFFDKDSRVLILGTIPSPKSREQGFYYGHPQNRFWRALCAAIEEPLPSSIAEKKEMLLRRGIALWDVLASCEISGAADHSIRNPILNDFSSIFSVAAIQAVFTTGKTAARLYQKFSGSTCICLPSPSPANCAFALEDLIQAYRAIVPYLKKE